MAKKISELPVVVGLSSGSLVPVVATNTYKATIKDLHYILNNDAGLNEFRTISGNVFISGHQNISGNLGVSGNLKVGTNSQDLLIIVGGVRQSGNSLISGNIILTGDFNATGNITLGKNANTLVNISGETKLAGNQTIYGNLTVIGSGDISNNLRVTGSGIFGNPNSLTQSHIFFGKTTLNSTGIVNDALYVSGNITGGADLYIHNNSYFNNSVFITGDSRIGLDSSKTLTVYAAQVNNSSFTANANAIFNSNIDIVGAIRTSGNVFLGNDVNDNVWFGGRAICNNGFSASGLSLISGGVYLSGNLNASGLSIFHSGLAVRGGLTVTGNTTLGYEAQHSTHVRGTGYVGQDLIISGNLRVSGNVFLDKAISGDNARYITFNPSIRVCGIRKMSYLGNYYGDGRSIAKLEFSTNGGANEWHESNKRHPYMPSSGYVFITGLNETTATPTTMPRCFMGVHRVAGLEADNIKVEVSGAPEGVDITGDNADQRPVILASWNTGDLIGVSGVIPIIDLINYGNPYTPHWKIVFNKPLKSGSYFPYFTMMARHTSQLDNDGGGSVTPYVSYLDTGFLPTECIVTFNRATNYIRVSNSSNQTWFNGNGCENPAVPRLVKIKFEEY